MKTPREERLSRGISQEALACYLEIDARRLSDYETGRRRWPIELLEKALRFLTQAEPLEQNLFLPMEAQLRMGGRRRWEPVPEHGQNWAEIQPAYENLYRRLDLSKLPPLAFRRHVRCDSRQEPLAWTCLFIDGAQGIMASPNLLGCSPYPPVDPQGHSLGLQPRAAIWKPDHYILFPQLSILANERVIRTDGMVLNLGRRKRNWSRVELDGGAHQNPAWDLKQDQQLLIPTLRFSSDVVLGLRFAQELQARLGCIAA